MVIRLLFLLHMGKSVIYCFHIRNRRKRDMTRKEDMAALRACTEVHYNCAQSVILPFAGDMGMDRDQLYALALNFGGGMGCGGTCGAMIGALIALGGLGQPQEKRYGKEHGGSVGTSGRNRK